MTFTKKDWHDSPLTDTPLSAGAMEDLEGRLSAFTAAVAGAYAMVMPWRAIAIPQSTAAATLVLPEGGSTGLAASGTDPALGMIYVDPADYSLADLTTKFRLRAALAANATAPTTNFTVGLYPVTAVAGGSNALTLTLGTVVSGSTVAFNAPSASTRAQGNSGDFTPPAAGWYALGVVLSGTNAASSRIDLSACLQKHYV